MSALRQAPLAEPGSRLLAVAIDAALPTVPGALVLAIGVWAKSGVFVRTAAWTPTALSIVLGLVDLFLLIRFGQTIGKRLLGLRIVGLDGERVGFLRLVLVRTLGVALLSLIPIAGQLFALVDALMIFSKDRRTLHDRLARTLVVDVRAGSP
jgi:uncharacterized RDD family membrane protein YckC